MVMNPDVAARATGFPNLGFDPAPGDMRSVSASSRQYSTIAERLRSAQEAIDAIVKQRGIWEGEASEAFARRVGELPKYLDKAATSMTKAAGALAEWTDSLDTMQQSAKDLEHQARKAKRQLQEAKNNPAFDLVDQSFTDPEALRSAQTAINNAATHLDNATNRLDAIITSARRIRKQHAELAERVAAMLNRAREMAPEEPGLLGKVFSDIGDMVTDFANTMIDAGREIFQAINDFVEDNANLIGEISTVVGDIGTIIGTIGDFLPPPASEAVGTVSNALGKAAALGHLVAKSGGADLGGDTAVLDGVGMATGRLSGRGWGLVNAGFQISTDYAAHAQGEDVGTPFGKFMNADERQVEAGADIITGILTGESGDHEDSLDKAISATPLVGHWKFDLEDAAAKDEAGQAERDQQRARERVWE